MGAVYLAEDQQLERKVAIKFLSSGSPEMLARFRREARAAARLKHPNIVTIHEFGEHQGTPFIAMEYVEGETLAQRLEKGALPSADAVDIALQMCEGLARAHEVGITHRDIKPDNVVIDRDGRARILDFGLAKYEDATALTAENTTVGTISYMSPEQATGRAVDGRSDVFSLGAVLYEMVTGKPPFAADRSAAVIYKIIHEAPDELSTEIRSVSPQLETILLRALAKTPDDRFPSAREFGDALRVMTGQAILARPLRTRWKPVAGVAAGIVLISSIALVVFNPFKLTVTTGVDATAGEKKLAVMYFDNLVEPDDPERRGEIVTELLITGLSETDQLSVVSSQRLYDVLKQMGREGEKKIDRTTATEVARRANARWMMQGRILQAEPSLVVTSQIVEVATGDVAASQRTEGNPGESIFALVDRITTETLKDLGARGSSLGPASVAAISTTSEEAYRYYLEGLEFERKKFTRDSWKSFEKALAIDSTFAMAAFRRAQWGGQTPAERRHYLSLAVRHADRASTKEQMYLQAAAAMLEGNFSGRIRAFEAVLAKYPEDKYALEILAWHYANEEPAKAIEYGTRLVKIDPFSVDGHNALAYAYSNAGDLEQAIRAIDKYIELAPNEPNPYDSRGDIYAKHGILDGAIASYAKAVEIKPDFAGYASAGNLGCMYVYKGEYDKARAAFSIVFKSSEAGRRSHGRHLLISLAAWRGMMAEALDQIDAARAVDEIEGSADTQVALAEVRFLHELGEHDAALAAVQGLEELDTGDAFSSLSLAAQYASIGHTEEAREYLKRHEAQQDTSAAWEKHVRAGAEGVLELARGNYDAAIGHFEKVPWPEVRLLLVQAYFKAKRWDDVITLAERITSHYDTWRIRYPVRAVRLHYYLGVAYQQVGRDVEALEQLEKFLWIWQEADPRLEGPEDARRRLAVLKSDESPSSR